MPLNFAQIGSAPNVQQVGEGTAYVYDKQKSPLLELGEKTLAMKMARDKEAAKAKADKAEKATMLTSENAGIFNDVHQDFFDNNVATFTAGGGDIAAQQEAAKKNAFVKTSALANKELSNEINRIDQEANKAHQNGDLDLDLYTKLKNEKLIEAKNAYVNAPDKVTGLKAFNAITSTINPTEMMAKSSRVSESKIKDLGKEVSTDLRTTISNSGIGGGGVITEKNRHIVQSRLDNLINANWQKPIFYQTYAVHDFDKKLSEGTLDNFKGFIDNNKIPKRDDDYVWKDEKGSEHRISRDAWGKNEFEKHTLSYTDSDINKSFSHNWIPGAGVNIGGGAGEKGAMLTPAKNKFTITDANAAGDVISELPGYSFTAAKPSQQLHLVKGSGEAYVVKQPGDKTNYGIETIGAGQDLMKGAINFTFTNKAGQSKPYTDLIVYDSNGDIDVKGTASKLKEKMAKGYTFGNKIGGMVSATKIDKENAQLVSSSDQETPAQQRERMKKAAMDAEGKTKASQLLFPITGKNANVGRSMYNEITNNSNFSDYASKTPEGKKLQQALDLAFKESGSVGGSTGGGKTGIGAKYAKKITTPTPAINQ